MRKALFLLFLLIFNTSFSQNKAEKLITDKTKAIIPVHIAGYPCDIEGIARLAKKYNLVVVAERIGKHKLPFFELICGWWFLKG